VKDEEFRTQLLTLVSLPHKIDIAESQRRELEARRTAWRKSRPTLVYTLNTVDMWRANLEELDTQARRLDNSISDMQYKYRNLMRELSAALGDSTWYGIQTERGPMIYCRFVIRDDGYRGLEISKEAPCETSATDASESFESFETE
jgi:hypothetical protein